MSGRSEWWQQQNASIDRSADPTDGDVPTWDAAAGAWVLGAGGGGTPGWTASAVVPVIRQGSGVSAAAGSIYFRPAITFAAGIFLCEYAVTVVADTPGQAGEQILVDFDGLAAEMIGALGGPTAGHGILADLMDLTGAPGLAMGVGNNDTVGITDTNGTNLGAAFTIGAADRLTWGGQQRWQLD